MPRSFARIAAIRTPAWAECVDFKRHRCPSIGQPEWHPRSAETARLSKAECLEMIFAAASQGISECLDCMILALEASEVANADRIDVDDGGAPY
ncbi:MAG: hypothetical protein GEU95_03760 [Rhizobiales bacterium]|nr:hypothetical protein [Hyphomicrobiales bacterium]